MKRKRMELLIMRIAVATMDAVPRLWDLFVGEVNTDIKAEDLHDISNSEMIQGMMGIMQFDESPSPYTINLTAKTMTAFELNDRLKEEGIDIAAD